MPIWTCVVLFALYLLLDWSGIGPHSIRDRIAALLCLAALVGFSGELGVAEGLARWCASISVGWRRWWSGGAVFMGLWWIVAMAPPMRQLANLNRITLRRGTPPIPGAHGTVATGSRINGHLLVVTAGFALSIPLLPPSIYRTLVTSIVSVVMSVAGPVGVTIGSWIGWS